MTYSVTKPDPSPSPALDASIIRSNFLTYANAFAVNHSALNTANQGDHEKITLLQTVADFTPINNSAVLYTKNATSAAGTTLQVFSRIPKFLPTSTDTTDAPNNPVQLTYDKVNIVGPMYQSFLAGGYLIYSGSVVMSGAGNATITLSPTPSKILSVLSNPTSVTVNGAPFAVVSTITQPATILLTSTTAAAGRTFLWIAISQA